MGKISVGCGRGRKWWLVARRERVMEMGSRG
jgi:hypothetical protein